MSSANNYHRHPHHQYYDPSPSLSTSQTLPSQIPPSSSSSSSYSSTTVTSMSNFEPPTPIATPIKKKRGRPPKPNSLSQRITHTMNININKSPFQSPAESNSNSIVKQGQPDYFTPLMRVSPTNRSNKSVNNEIHASTKRRRKNSTTTSTASSGTTSPTLIRKSNLDKPSLSDAKPLISSGKNQFQQLLSPVSRKSSSSSTEFSLKLQIDQNGKAVLSNDAVNNSLSQNQSSQNTKQNDNYEHHIEEKISILPTPNLDHSQPNSHFVHTDIPSSSILLQQQTSINEFLQGLNDHSEFIMTDLLQSNQQEQNYSHHQSHENQQNYHHYQNVHQDFTPVDSSSSSDDSGDARLALKRMMRIRRR